MKLKMQCSKSVPKRRICCIVGVEGNQIEITV